MATNLEQKAKVIRQLTGFQKESHAKSLAEGLLRTCRDDPAALKERVKQANAVAAKLMGSGVSSFFAAEWAKVYSDSKEALSARRQLVKKYRDEFSLPKGRAAKMADCIVFAAAKKQDPNAVPRLSELCAGALNAGVPFTVVVDVVYYNAADVAPEVFANRCVSTSVKKNAPLPVSEVELASRLASAVRLSSPQDWLRQ